MIRRTSPAFGLAVLALFAVLSPEAWGQNASLLRDIGTEGPATSDGGSFFGMAASSDRLYFVVQLEKDDREVWTSDGTAEGTGRLRDGCPGECTQRPFLVGALGRTMLWDERDSQRREQLWRSDGTRPGTYPLTVDPPGSHISGRRAFFAGALYFERCRPESTGLECDLWRTEGTLASTRLVDAAPRSIAWLQSAGDRLYYLASDGAAWELWTLSRGAATPVRLHRFAAPLDSPPNAQVVAEGRLFLVARAGEGTELWTSDGSAAGTKALSRMSEHRPNPDWLKVVGSRCYFVAYDERFGSELWRSDGTAAGTLRVTSFEDPFPFPFESDSMLAAAGDQVYFVAKTGGVLRLWSTRGTPETTLPLSLPCAGCVPPSNGVVYEGEGKVYFYLGQGSGTNLWVTDGTAAGTHAVIPDCASGECYLSLSVWKGGVLVLVRRSSEFQFWVTDGTPSGTRPWIEFSENQGGISPQPVDLAGRTYFLAHSLGAAESSTTLWTREGNGATKRVALLGRKAVSSNARGFLALGDQVLFAAKEEGFGARDLWRSSGTPESTIPLGAPFPSPGTMERPVRSGGLAYFKASDSATTGLWRTDGSVAGTLFLRQVRNPALPPVAAAGGVVYFDGRELWRSDGTPAGTVKSGEVPAAMGTIVEAFAAPQGIFLLAQTAPGAREVWISDGTAAGTRLLTRLGAGEFAGTGFEITVAGGSVYFVGPDGIWKSDGSAEGTKKIVARGAEESFLNLSPCPGGLCFFRHMPLPSSAFELQLRQTDGTAAGSSELATFRLPQFSPFPSALVTVGERAYLAVDDGVHGQELWSTDGTPGGTALVKDILPGLMGSNPTALVDGAGALYFAAGENVHGLELWRSDGTADGTRLAQDVAPQAASSSPQDLTVAGGRLYFSADDGLTGREPWVLPLAGGAACRASSTRLCLGGGRYAVEAAWRDHRGTEGAGHPVGLTADTGYFWFFDPANVEAVLKVLDGRGVNGHVWTFYGALSDVEYALTVTDTETGLTHRYVNPEGQLASVADTRSFGPLGASPVTGPAVTTSAAQGAPLALVDRRVVARAATGACAPSSARLCLNGSRYSVEVAWKDFSGNTGMGQAVGLTADTGYFWFFDAANVELVLKVLDGTAVNGHRWVFYGALSSVEYTVTVTDTQTGEIKTYRNPSGNLASVADTEAF